MKQNGRWLAAGLGLWVVFAFRRAWDLLIPLLLREQWGWGDTASGLLMGADELFLLVLGPAFFFLSNRPKGAWGRRGPYILAGGALSAGLLLLLPLACVLGSRGLFFLAGTGALTGISAAAFPAWQLASEGGKEGKKWEGAPVLVGGAGGLLTLVLGVWLYPGSGDAGIAFALGTALVMAAGLAGTGRWIIPQAAIRTGESEPSVPASQAGSPALRSSLLRQALVVALWSMSWNGILPAFSRYARYYWEADPAAGGMAIAAWLSALALWLPSRWLAGRLEEKKLAAVGTFLLAAAMGAMIFCRRPSSLAALLLAVAGAGWSLSGGGMLSLLQRLSGSPRLGGRCWLLAVAAGGAVSPLLSGMVMQYLGYKYLFLYGTLLAAVALLSLLKDMDPPQEPALMPQNGGSSVQEPGPERLE